MVRLEQLYRGTRVDQHLGGCKGAIGFGDEGGLLPDDTGELKGKSVFPGLHGMLIAANSRIYEGFGGPNALGKLSSRKGQPDWGLIRVEQVSGHIHVCIREGPTAPKKLT